MAHSAVSSSTSRVSYRSEGHHIFSVEEQELLEQGKDHAKRLSERWGLHQISPADEEFAHAISLQVGSVSQPAFRKDCVQQAGHFWVRDIVKMAITTIEGCPPLNTSGRRYE